MHYFSSDIQALQKVMHAFPLDVENMAAEMAKRKDIDHCKDLEEM